jgi:hypothetical protein
MAPQSDAGLPIYDRKQINCIKLLVSGIRNVVLLIVPRNAQGI